VSCLRVFQLNNKPNLESLWPEYSQGKQTYNQLAKKYNCSVRTIQRKLDKYELIQPPKLQPRPVVVLMDSTYWGRGFGVMLFKDDLTGENLLKYFIQAESNLMYERGIRELQNRGYEILAIVCDGRRGLLKSFGKIPVQMCQFHQAAIIRRYITKNPKTPASIELKSIVDILSKTDKESFEGVLDEWVVKWESFLNERTRNPETGKSHYTHRRLRSAYRSLKTNMPWIWTWYENPAIKIPNTTNAIEGHFAHLKNKLRNHNGLTLERKKKFIDGFLKA
jgi:hypothetical protein